MIRQQQYVECSRTTIKNRVADENVLENKEEEDTEALKEELSTDEYIEKSKFERRKKDEDNDDDTGRLITIQFCTILPVVASNYILANEFKNDEHDEEMLDKDEEAVCTLEGEGDTSIVNQLAHSNDEEDDDGITNIEEEIDLETERRIRRVSYNNLLKQLYQEGNPMVGLLGKPMKRSFDYYILYRMPTKKKKVPLIEKYGLPHVIVPPPMGWKEPSMDVVQFEKLKRSRGKEILQVCLSDEAKVEENTERVEVNAKKKVVFRKPSIKLTKHLRPLYVKALVNGTQVAKVLIDNGAEINTILYRMVKKFSKSENDLILTGLF
ncbi:Retrotrans gag domain-containing protein [Abeliophyllum distichum]|uniref:Retrotrans gag domain-containing protein n=1 Tax=Abeliophyllum distichum TaxID=126358 RepID=A0ABD1UNG4_9LAMI